MKIPSYSGTFGEDFAAFERNFNEAAKDNKVSKGMPNSTSTWEEKC